MQIHILALQANSQPVQILKKFERKTLAGFIFAFHKSTCSGATHQLVVLAEDPDGRRYVGVDQVDINYLIVVWYLSARKGEDIC